MKLQQYALNPMHEQLLLASFTKVFDGCRIEAIRSKDARSEIVDGSGCYLWTMRLHDTSYAIYVGRTTSIVRRVRDYGGEFQIQSPNDFKIRLVDEVLSERFPDAVFDLYFEQVEPAECNAREQSLIAAFRPLVNNLPRPTPEERSAVEQAYRRFYSELIHRHLAGDG